MYKLLYECRQIEELASRIYLLLSKNNYPDEIREVFRKLSGDEKSHARNLDLILQGTGHEELADVRLSWQKIDEAAQMAKKFLCAVEREPMDEKKALKLSVEMENLFRKVHAQNVLHVRNKRLTELFNELEREDEAHIETLKSCLTWWHLERKPTLRKP